MNLESSNAFLKILEEPPQNNYFVLTTANEKVVLQTIRSRCHKIFFNAFSDEELKKILTYDPKRLSSKRIRDVSFS